MKMFLSHLSLFVQWLAAVTLVIAHNVFATTFKTPSLHLGVVADTKDSLDQQIARSLDQLSERLGKMETIEKAVAKNAADYESVTKVLGEVSAQMLDIRKMQLAARQNAPRKRGHVSDDCAAYLGALYLKAGLQQERLTGKIADYAQGEIANILGKTALSSSDIPLPTEYRGEVVELVSQFGAARRFGTIFPLGSGVVKLPKLGTDPTFGLITPSGTVTEKSPTVSFVTFTSEKFGGLVRLPSEIDEESIVAMGQFLARYGSRQIAYVEDYNFFRSTGAASGVNGTAEGLTKSVVTDSKTVALASTKTHNSDLTLAKARELRSIVDAAALGMSAYYFHPTFEQLLSTFNTSGDKPYIANGINGASLDGFPIRWVDVLPAYSTSVAASQVFGLFGDVSFNYLGLRGGMRADTSKEAGFTTDEILVRFLERLTVGKMAVGAVGGVITAAS